MFKEVGKVCSVDEIERRWGPFSLLTFSAIGASGLRLIKAANHRQQTRKKNI